MLQPRSHKTFDGREEEADPVFPKGKSGPVQERELKRKSVALNGNVNVT